MINCIAVDDERLSLELLEDNIRQVPFLSLVKTCQNAFEAMEIMRQQPIDLIFLDIQMPGISGTQFIQSMVKRPMIIFITAYRKYALEGFELDVLDYLVKPVTPERFLRAVNKAADQHSLRQQTSPVENPAQSEYLFVNVEYNLVKIMVRDITHIEGLKDYVRIHLSGPSKPVVTKLSMKSLSDKLPAERFVRVHKSFIVSIDKVSFIRKNRIYIQDHIIPVSDFYKDELNKFITPHSPR